MKAIRQILAAIRRADQTYNLIENGDKIVVGLSGGKDSVALLYCLHLYQKFSQKHFQMQPVMLDLGFTNFNSELMFQFCDSLHLKLMVSDSREVYKILQAHQSDKKHLPCSICSRMKKAAINKVANNIGFNKVAFAHHMDDAIETLFLNEIYGARIATFSPKMDLENANITFIRPLIFAREKQIQKLINEESLPVSASPCPADRHTNRELIKDYLDDLYKEFPSSYDNFATMLNNDEHLDLHFDKTDYQINQNGLILEPAINKYQILQAMDIRYKVFVEEQHIAYKDEFIIDEERNARTFLIKRKGKTIGTIRYREIEEGIKIERMAIIKKERGKGYGRQTLVFLIDFLKKKYTPTTIIIHAQYQLVDFYLSLGFVKENKPFREAKIKHQKMVKYV